MTTNRLSISAQSRLLFLCTERKHAELTYFTQTVIAFSPPIFTTFRNQNHFQGPTTIWENPSLSRTIQEAWKPCLQNRCSLPPNSHAFPTFIATSSNYVNLSSCNSNEPQSCSVRLWLGVKPVDSDKLPSAFCP